MMTPEAFMEAAERLDKVKADLLFDTDLSGLESMAEQFLLAGIAAIEQANANLKLACFSQRRALAGGR